MAVVSQTKADEYSSNSREGKTITISNTTTVRHYRYLPSTLMSQQPYINCRVNLAMNRIRERTQDKSRTYKSNENRVKY
jgi:hypothetical protein